MAATIPNFVFYIVLAVVIFFWLFSAVLNGIAMQKLMQSKGFDGNWFWQGFLFGPLAFLGASTRENRGKAEYPEYIKEAIQKATDEHNLATGGWKCPQCGRINPAITGTCVCGADKNGNVTPKK